MKKTSNGIILKLVLVCSLIMCSYCEFIAAQKYLVTLMNANLLALAKEDEPEFEHIDPEDYIGKKNTWFDLKKLYNQYKNGDEQHEEIKISTAFLKRSLIALKSHRIDIIMSTMKDVYGQNCFWKTIEEAENDYEENAQQILNEDLPFYTMSQNEKNNQIPKLLKIRMTIGKMQAFNRRIEGDLRFLKCGGTIYIMSSFGSDTPTSDFDYSILKEYEDDRNIDYGMYINNITIISFFLEKVALTLKEEHCGGVDAETCLDSNGYPDIMEFYKANFLRTKIENREDSVNAFFTNAYSSKLLRVCGVSQIYLQKTLRFKMLKGVLKERWQASIDICSQLMESAIHNIAIRVGVDQGLNTFNLLGDINFMNLDDDDGNFFYDRIRNHYPEEIMFRETDSNDIQNKSGKILREPSNKFLPMMMTPRSEEFQNPFTLFEELAQLGVLQDTVYQETEFEQILDSDDDDWRHRSIEEGEYILHISDDSIKYVFEENPIPVGDYNFKNDEYSFVSRIIEKPISKNYKKISKMMEYFTSEKRFVECIQKISYPQFFLKKMYTKLELPMIMEFKKVIFHSWDNIFFTQNDYNPEFDLPINKILLPFLGACHIWASEAYVTFGALDYVKREKHLLRTFYGNLKFQENPLYLAPESLLETFTENFGMMLFHIGEEGCTGHNQNKFDIKVAEHQSISDAFSKYVRRALTALRMKSINEVGAMDPLFLNGLEFTLQKCSHQYTPMWDFYREIETVELSGNNLKKEQYFVIFKKHFKNFNLEQLMIFAHGFYSHTFTILMENIDYEYFLPYSLLR